MQFTATTRSVQGTGASRRLRRAGRVPAIVYGGNAEPLSIELDHNEIFHALRKEEFHSSVLDMQLDGKGASVLLRAVQWHPYKQQVLHVDFQRVAANQALHTKVPLHFVNAENSPAVKLGGAVVSHVVTEVDVSCLPADLPQFIEVDLAELVAGQSVHLSDLKAPKGVTFTGNGDTVVVTAPVSAAAASEESNSEEQK
ncbi:50S ribosomal protein L25/general stress protein Ctc [Pigmentiphaga soli]|uniref:Large ribosomal subunit protein bL25 n=1 Tax=Pigmentiphaga soli TaxID=1007095 RepID=A0ABP8HH09_9BURK